MCRPRSHQLEPHIYAIDNLPTWNHCDKAFLTLRVDFDVHRLYLAGCENPDTTVVVSFSLDLAVSICSQRNLYCEGEYLRPR